MSYKKDVEINENDAKVEYDIVILYKNGVSKTYLSTLTDQFVNDFVICLEDLYKNSLSGTICFPHGKTEAMVVVNLALTCSIEFHRVG